MKIRDEIILREAVRRAELRRNGSSVLTDPRFPQQTAFVLDPSRYPAALCTRRAGKTSGFAIRFFNAARKHPGAILPYFALTRDSARNIMWPVLREMNDKFKIGAELVDSKLRCRVPGGAEIVLMGADMPNFIGRVRGIKTPFAAIDEAQKFRNSILTELIDDILTPAIADYDDGTLGLGGTPGPLPKGKFFDITSGKEGFSIHKWSVFDNPYMPNARAFVDDLKKRKGWNDQNPTYRREWLGEWVADTDALVYKYDEGRNSTAILPPADHWSYVLGVDLGYDPDPSAFVLCAYRPHDPTLYIVETFKKTKMIVSDVADKIKTYLARCQICSVVMDAGAQGKQIAEEIRRRHSIPVHAADKHGKSGFIELMNSDMTLGRIKVVKGSADGLVDEWLHLIWDPDESERKEHPEYDNHEADAALYAWRWAHNYAWKGIPKRIDPNSEEAVDAWAEKKAREIERANKIPWDLDLDDDY
jgi:hypothetical protein